MDEAERVYAGTDTGLFRSTDQGAHWSQSEGIEPGKISALAVEGESILVVIENTIWSNGNGGWKKIITKEGSPLRYLSWSKEDRFLAASEQKLWEGNRNGQWKEIKGNLPIGLKITALAIDTQDRGVLYLGSDRGLFWSGDGGATWHPARLYQGERFEKQVNQILPLSNGSIWLATEEDGVLLGVNKVPRGSRWVQWFKQRLG